MPAPIPVIDLFAGPGGLGEGFSARRDPKTPSRFRIRLSIEKDPIAHQTLLLRSFFRQFDIDDVPRPYFQRLRGEITLEKLFEIYPRQAASAAAEAWRAELGTSETSAATLRERMQAALGNADDWVLIGGPPCQAYSLAGRSRNKGRKDYQFEKDPKSQLYLEYLQIIADWWPSVFVMENVKGLLSSKFDGQGLFAQITDDLTDPARAIERSGRIRRRFRKHRYSLHALAPSKLSGNADAGDFLIRSELFGIPQARHRVIIVGVRDDFGGGRLPHLPAKPAPTVETMIRDLPRLRSGLSKDGDSSEEWMNAVLELCSPASLRKLNSECDRQIASILKGIPQDRAKMTKLDRGAEFVKGEPCIQYERGWFVDDRLRGFCNHSTRAHIRLDLHRYLFAAAYASVLGASPELADFPKSLLPLHQNVNDALEGSHFADRFRVQLRSRHATTITSHISKDGHYYIHYDPMQCRSLTVREAARIQTFPDSYFFEGPRTAQYIQVGNAVPPLLAKQIADSVAALFT